MSRQVDAFEDRTLQLADERVMQVLGDFRLRIGAPKVLPRSTLLAIYFAGFIDGVRAEKNDREKKLLLEVQR